MLDTDGGFSIRYAFSHRWSSEIADGLSAVLARSISARTKHYVCSAIISVMKKALLYYTSIAVCGGAAGLMGVSGLLSGSVTLVSILFAVGGVGMVFGVFYEMFLSSDPSTSVPDDRLVWFTVAMAVLVVLAGSWSLIT